MKKTFKGMITDGQGFAEASLTIEDPVYVREEKTDDRERGTSVGWTGSYASGWEQTFGKAN